MKRADILFGAATLAAGGVLAHLGDARSAAAQAAPAAQPLASWNDGPAKRAILDFVKATTTASGANFVKPEDRIATFDQDGTLWVEQPIYVQAAFAVDRVLAMAPDNPLWKKTKPYSAILSGDKAAMAKFSEQDWEKIVAVTHSGMTTEAFDAIATKWIATAKHPRYKRLYTDLVYRPMLEVMQYLRANGFATYIVTGGGQEFVRTYAQRVYGVPREQVIGSTGGLKYEYVDGEPVLMKLPDLAFNDNDAGKVLGIEQQIGKRPYAAFGNSTGDRQMLEWTGAGGGARLKMLVHHDDAVREYAYGPAGGLPNSSIGTFSEALLGEAKTRDWTVISMKGDWRRIFATE
jgi:FMN phosphatase YigB (HAD superfamily)